MPISDRFARFVLSGLVPTMIFASATSSSSASTLESDVHKLVRSDVGHVHTLAVAVAVSAYEKLGIRVVVERRPPRRSLIEANNGLFDAEAGRVEGTAERFSNLLPITALPIAHITGLVYTRDDTLRARSFDDLRGRRIVIRRGELFAERGTEGMRASAVGTYGQLFDMLIADHVDAAIGIDENARWLMERKYAPHGVRALTPPIHVQPIYHLIHRRHRHLVEPFAEALLDMDRSGEIATIRERVTSAIERCVRAVPDPDAIGQCSRIEVQP